MNLTVEYDLAPLAGVARDTFAPPGKGLWRFRHLLPARSAEPVSLGEGATPLVHLERLGRRTQETCGRSAHRIPSAKNHRCNRDESAAGGHLISELMLIERE